MARRSAQIKRKQEVRIVKTATAIRHISFEDMGTFATVLAQRGITLNYLDAGVDDLAQIDACAPDLLVILGGPISACDDENYPFIQDELQLIKRRLHADLPTLGICLGAQLIARALGAKVYPGPVKEIGWSALTLTEAGRQSPLCHLAAAHTQLLHWHGDSFDLPTDARLLASTDLYRHQAFSWGRHTLAFQCHPEISTAGFERWLIGHTGEIAAAQRSVTQLRAQTKTLGPTLEVQAMHCFSDWLDLVQC